MSRRSAPAMAILVPVGALALILAFSAGLYIAGMKVQRQNAVAENPSTSTGTDQPPVCVGGKCLGELSETASVEWLPGGRREVAVPAPFLDAVLRGVSVAYPNIVNPTLDTKVDGVPLRNIITSAAYDVGTIRAKGNPLDGQTLSVFVYTQLMEMGTAKQAVYYTRQDAGGGEGYVLFAKEGRFVGFGSAGFSRRNDASIDMTWKDIKDSSIIMNTTTLVGLEDPTVGTQVDARLIGSDRALPLFVAGMGMFQGTVPTQAAWTREPVGTLPSGEKLYFVENTEPTNAQATSRQGLMAVRPDGFPVLYQIDLSFWQPDIDERYGMAFGARPVQGITWSDGGPEGGEYLNGKYGGCGIVHFSNIVDGSVWAPFLKQVGTTTTKEKIFGVSDMQGVLGAIPEAREEYASWKQISTSTQALRPHQQTAGAFAALRPFFFYQNVLGEWMKFTSNDIIAAAECGKPVLYFYPPKTTDLTVELSPRGGFTKVEPAYNNGWRITAHPDGRLVNADDGKTYPYLFWEGRGGLYQEPENYWVVARADVERFLDGTLAKFAFNAKEIADFKEFWLPRMQGAPYYKIGFHGTGVMNELAPLDVHGATVDTLVRVLMDYQPLQAPMASKPAPIRTPVRRGFTVMEWGGVLR
jgi:hypothetical protein